MSLISHAVLALMILVMAVLISSQDEETRHICDEYCVPGALGFCNSSGCLLPNNPQVFIGHNLTLNCTLRYSNRSDELYFTWKNDVMIQPEYQRVISPYTVQLNLPITEADADVTVLCRDNAIGTIWPQRVSTDYPPRNVTNIEIIVNDWRTLSLTWDLQQYINRSNGNITVIWTASGANSWYYCDILNKTYCFLDSGSYKNAERYNFNITVESMNKNVTQYVDFHSKDYVKPSPVSTLLVESKTSHSVTLKWNHTKSYKGLIFSVAVTRDKFEIEKNTTEALSLTIHNLRPFETYNFAVLAKSRQGGYWSDAVSQTVKTREDKPDRGPEVIAGGFYAETRCLQPSIYRNVTIYAKPPSKEHMNGKLITYSLTFVSSNGDPNITSYQLDAISLSCSIDYDVYITVHTAIGASPPSYLHIPRAGIAARPENVQVSVSETSANVTWESGSADSPWAVFWCPERNIGLTKTCKDDIHWQKVDGSKRSETITNSWNTTLDIRYGVSMATQNSSGVIWSDCLYGAANSPVTKPDKPVVENRPNLGLTVHWANDVCYKKDSTLVTQYIIKHCHNTGTVCESNTVSSSHSRLVIPNLNEGVPYSIRLKQVAVSGAEGPFSDAVYGTPINTDLNAGEIFGIVFGCAIILVLTLTVVVQCFRYSRRKWKDREQIEVPIHFQGYILEIESPPQPIRQYSVGNERTWSITEQRERLVSIDSGRSSLTSVAIDILTSPGQSPIHTSPNGQFQPSFEPVVEEGSACGSGSKQDMIQQLPQGYSLFDIDSSSSQDTEIAFSDDQIVAGVLGDPGGSSNDWFNFESDSANPYVTAGSGDEDEEEDESDNSSEQLNTHKIVTVTSPSIPASQGDLDITNNQETQHETSGQGQSHITGGQDNNGNGSSLGRDQLNKTDDDLNVDNKIVKQVEIQQNGRSSPEDEGLGSLESVSVKSVCRNRT